MERPLTPETAAPVPSSGVFSRIWIVVLGGLIAFQGWMTLCLFAPPADGMNTSAGPIGQRVRQCWRRVIDDEPILSGQHPLHLYFGLLGAEAFQARGSLCSFDPSFQAGFPKTPVFDSGSRPAELFLFLAGAQYQPAAYKLGLAVCCCLMPAVIAITAYSVGLGHGAACLCAALGILVWCGTPCREQLHEGNIDLLMASLSGLSFVGWLLRFDRSPGFGCWLALSAAAAVTWFAHPFFCLLLTPLVLAYYSSVGVRHALGWHSALFLGLGVAPAVNAFWLIDWCRSWWIRLPLQVQSVTLKHRTLQTLWSASLWGDNHDRTLGLALLGLAGVGIIVLNLQRQRNAARLLGIGIWGFWLLAMGGIAWHPLGCMGTSALLVSALWFAVIPAVFALQSAGLRLAIWTGSAGRAAVLIVGTCAGAAIVGSDYFLPWLRDLSDVPPLIVGLGPEQRQLVELLRHRTTNDARILWEDRSTRRDGMRWTVLLPVLTNRDFIGGLAPEACIEHAQSGIIDRVLAGRPLTDWSDAELDDYCRRYNIGWVVCWSPTVIERFRSWQGASDAAPVRDGDDGCLFAVGPRSFLLKGQARWLKADRHHIALADVIPEDGQVILSMHYHAGLRASPLRVQVERETDPYDPIHFIRLRVPGPTALITLTWDDP